MILFPVLPLPWSVLWAGHIGSSAFPAALEEAGYYCCDCYTGILGDGLSIVLTHSIPSVIVGVGGRLPLIPSDPAPSCSSAVWLAQLATCLWPGWPLLCLMCNAAGEVLWWHSLTILHSFC